jgi:2-oxoglutarate dehydrogenase E2 component (dihydrolipoamide succinyltransferase)
VILSPAARAIAEEKGIDPGRLTGSGRGGRVTKEDVLNYLEGQPQGPAEQPGKSLEPTPPAAASPAQPAPPSEGESALSGRETRQRMSSIRQRIADRLLASQKATATLTTFNEADLSAILALRDQYKDRFRDKYGVGLGFMSFFVKACVEALRAFPLVNARIDGADVVYPNAYHIGVAVSTEKGLMVPVIRDSDRLSFAAIEKRIAELAQRAREGKISVTDLQGGTFTITNGGVFGSLLSTPILNPPQSAILGMHTIQQRPVAVGDQVVIRPMMYLALSYDHRLIDGREAVQFLVRVKECVEAPSRLLLEV